MDKRHRSIPKGLEYREGVGEGGGGGESLDME